MKKFLSILMLFAILLSVAACGAEETVSTQGTQTSEPTVEATEPANQSTGVHVPTAEEMYGHINQMEPIDGVYKIWNAEGVKNIINHPDAKFELLCTVDMEGAVLAPIGADQPFTGELKGANFFIKNFTVQGGDEESFGFISVNQGTLRNLVLENVTFIPGPNAKNIGSLAGENQGKILRCNVNSSTMTVETAPEGANCGAVVGVNTGELANGIAWVDLAFNSEAAANVGGIAGYANGGTVEFVETDGKLDIAGTNKNYGLFAGLAENVVLKNCLFVGATNFAGGERFINFTGNPDDNEREVALKALWRDNEKPELTEGQNRLRDRVVEEMNAMSRVEWHLHQDLAHSCTCSLSSCHGIYNTTYTYLGIPYNHKGGSLERMKYVIGEDGYLVDWVYDMAAYDGFDSYMGNDCSTALAHAWWTVSNSTDFSRVTYEIPGLEHIRNFKSGCYPVGINVYPEGEGWWENVTLDSDNWTDDFIEVNGEQKMMEAYALMRKGDGYAYIVEAGGHTRMAAEDPVVVRDQDGLISAAYSYVITTEQGSTTVDDVNGIFSSWKYMHKYTFGSLLGDWAVPVTCEELLTGEMEPAECTILDGADGWMGIFTGTVKANYYLDSVVLEIKDSAGNVVLNHKLFTTVDKKENVHNDGMLRNYLDEYDLMNFAMPLSKVALEKGETYSYTITGNLHTYDSFVVKEDTFVYGQAN